MRQSDKEVRQSASPQEEREAFTGERPATVQLQTAYCSSIARTLAQPSTAHRSFCRQSQKKVRLQTTSRQTDKTQRDSSAALTYHTDKFALSFLVGALPQLDRQDQGGRCFFGWAIETGRRYCNTRSTHGGARRDIHVRFPVAGRASRTVDQGIAAALVPYEAPFPPTSDNSRTLSRVTHQNLA